MIAATPTTAPHPVSAFLKPSLQERSTIAMAACVTASDLPCNVPVRVGLFLDGTNNNLERDKNGKRTGIINPSTKKQENADAVLLKSEEASHSNVARLFSAFPADKRKSGYFPYYIAGVGTPFPEIGELTETDDGKAFAKGGQARIVWGLFQVLNAIHFVSDGNQPLYKDDVVGKLAQSYDNEVGRVERDVENKQNVRLTHRDWFKPHLEKLQAKLAGRPKPNIPSLTVSVFGFSRGAAEATAFCHYFSELLDAGKLAGIPASIDFLGVFDIVATVGMSDSAGRTTIVPRAFFDGHWAWANKLLMPLPDCVKAGRHYIAAHEQRMNFPVTQLQPVGGDFMELFFPGVHSDVGGGYAPGEQGKGRGAQSSMVSQIPLAYMYKAARQAGVPLRPFSELEERDQLDFLVGAELASAWNAYTAELGNNGSLITQHMELYYRWRAARLTTLERTTSFKAASAQAQEDLRSSNNMLAGDLDALKLRRQMAGRRPDGEEPPPYTSRDLSRINQWQYYRAQHGTSLDKWESWLLGIFEKPEPLPPDVMRFFDDYLHDSLAGFYLAGAVTEFDKRAQVAKVKAMKEGSRSAFDKKVFALAQKVEAAQAKEKAHLPLTREEQGLVDEAKVGTPFPIMTDNDTADMRSALIKTQTATRREGGGYTVRRSFYPQAGFFKRESINEEELGKMPIRPVIKEKIDGKTIAFEYIWSDDLIGDFALLTPDPSEWGSDKMVA